MTMSVTLKWTDAAKEGFKTLPKEIRQGLLTKIESLRDCDPTQVHKPLTGPLAGCRTLKYRRYRVVYMTTREEIANGDILIHVTVTVIACAARKEGDRKDVYVLAKKLVESGLLSLSESEDEDD